jgi:hypothetical protein
VEHNVGLGEKWKEAFVEVAKIGFTFGTEEVDGQFAAALKKKKKKKKN